MILLNTVLSLLNEYGFYEAVKFLKEELNEPYIEALRRRRKIYENMLKEISSLPLSDKEKKIILKDLSDIAEIIEDDLNK